MVVMVASTVAKMFLTLFQAGLIYVNTSIKQFQFLPAAMFAVTIEGMSPAFSQVVLQIWIKEVWQTIC